jgi:hypothetical protein
VRVSNDTSHGVVCMSALAGMGLSFAAPWTLAAIPLALGALVYLFRARGELSAQVTSSLFIIKQLPQYLPSRRRFVPPLQFWLELLLAIALGLAASGMILTRTGARVAVVIDTSKSMGALISADETRLQAAVRIASADISQAPNDTRFVVLRAARVVSSSAASPGYLDRSGATSQISTVEPTYETDSLADALNDLQVRAEYDNIWLYTDRAIEGLGSASRLRVVTVPYDPDTAHNIWISSIQVRTPASSKQKDAEDNQILEIGLSRVGLGTKQVLIQATCSDRQSGATFDLPAVAHTLSASNTSLINLGPINSPWSFCRVYLEGVDDLLAKDNEAWIARTAAIGEIGVVSSLSLENLGLDRLPFGSIVAVNDGDKSEEQKLQEQKFRGIIYHRSEPTRLPAIPALVVYPQKGAKLWGALVKGDAPRGSNGSVEITRWDESHPLLQYVRPGLIALPTARVLECPSSARAIIHTVGGALLCAGESAGKRYAIFGFELFPFDGLRSPTLSIITLNTLQWLFSSSGATDSGASDIGLVDLPITGDAGERVVKYIAPREQELQIVNRRNVEASEPGVISVQEIDTARNEERLLAINSFSDQESNLALTAPISIPSAGMVLPRSDSRDTQSNHYQRLWAWSALIIVLIDLLRRIVLRSSWRWERG